MNIEPGSPKESREHSRSALLQHPGRKPRMTEASAGDHRPDSDVDLMAVIPDETAAKDADPILRHLVEGKYEVLWGKRSPSPGRSSGAQRPWLNPKRGSPPATGRP